MSGHTRFSLAAVVTLSMVFSSFLSYRGETVMLGNNSIMGEGKNAEVIKISDDRYNGNFVVYINWDGFPWFYYELANRNGSDGTPVINSLIKEGVLFTNAYTSIPSVTKVMQPSIASGSWPSSTGISGKFYDKTSGVVVERAPDNKTQTIAERALNQGINTVAIHQFAFRNKGAWVGNPKANYVYISKDADYNERFDMAIKLIRGENIRVGSKEYIYDDIPGFISIYIDDLDAIGHNEHAAYGEKIAATDEERIQNILKRLKLMDKKLGEFIQACKDRGIYDKMSFVLTTDHGMSPFGQRGTLLDEYGISKLDDLIEKIKAINYNVEYLTTGQKPKKNTDIILTGYGLEVQLSFVRSYTKNDVDRIVYQLKGEEYIGNILDNSEIVQRGGAADFADMIISPKPPYSFKANANSLYIARGQHDSLDDTSQHIFSLMWGKNIKKGYKYEESIYNIDFAPTMAKLLEITSSGDWDGQILKDAMEYNQQFDITQ